MIGVGAPIMREPCHRSCNPGRRSSSRTSSRGSVRSGSLTESILLWRLGRSQCSSALGRGKTVMIKHILGLLKPSSGVVKVDGKDLVAISEEQLYEVRRGTSVVLLGLSAVHLRPVLLAKRVRERGLRPPRADPLVDEEIDRVTNDALRMVGLQDHADRMPDELLRWNGQADGAGAGACPRVEHRDHRRPRRRARQRSPRPALRGYPRRPGGDRCHGPRHDP